MASVLKYVSMPLGAGSPPAAAEGLLGGARFGAAATPPNAGANAMANDGAFENDVGAPNKLFAIFSAKAAASL